MGMAGYPRGRRDVLISASNLQAIVATIFQNCGMSSRDASLLTETLVVADLRGCHSHGVLRVPEYVRKLKEGGVNPAGEPRVIKDSMAALVVDGGNSMGQIGATFAMRQAIERARTTNLAAAAVRWSNHCGAMAFYAMLALSGDMIGFATTHSLPTMAPWGGVEKILGINPLSVAIPAGDEPPVVLDIAFSASSHGKIRVYHQKGLAIPGNWAFDNHGNPTTDTEVALEGLLQPIGGYKGTGLALVMGLLSALLSGAGYGTETGNMIDGPKSGLDGHFFLALNVAAFEDPGVFKRRVDQIVRQIRGSKKAPGCDRIYSPGELEAETERRYRKEGIPLNSATLDGISQTAHELGIDASSLGGEAD
jgi:LDH2 family malate/lactate/ureidoglycolate dehydrogenase